MMKNTKKKKKTMSANVYNSMHWSGNVYNSMNLSGNVYRLVQGTLCLKSSLVGLSVSGGKDVRKMPVQEKHVVPQGILIHHRVLVYLILSLGDVDQLHQLRLFN